MYTLMQIIVFLNSTNVPQVTLLTHLEKLEQCENKIDQARDRYKSAGIETTMKNDEDGNSILELSVTNEKSITYMFCKKAIFYK
jgi:hypothetical protein